jgi:hypothetical protein
MAHPSRVRHRKGGAAVHDRRERITMPDYSTDHEREAYALGVSAALAAASWTVDGNTSPEHIVRVLAMLEDGDPMAYDYLPAYPNLSGEYSDDPTPRSLYEDITGLNHSEAEADAGLAYETLVGSVMDAIADAWEAGVSDTFEQACERELRASLPDPDAPHVGHFSRLGGTWWCDTCNSPYCDQA